MTAKQIHDRIEDCVTLLGFDYKGKSGHVDPYYIPEPRHFEYLLFFDGKEQLVYDMEAVMNTPFIMGHSLNEVADELIITEN